MNYRNLSTHQVFQATLVAACASAALNAGQAKALVTYEFIQQGSDVVMNVSGSVSVAPTGGPISWWYDSLLNTGNGIITSSTIPSGTGWSLENGPSNFGSGDYEAFTSYSGTTIGLHSPTKTLFLDENYTLGSPILGSGVIAGQTLASLGFGSTAPGLLASWNIAGSSETVEVRIGSNAPSSVPGPLPLLGAAAAFAHSRRLRARLRAGSSSPLT